MRVFLNVSVVLVCGGLAALSSFAQSAPTQAAVLPTALPGASRLVLLTSGIASPVTPIKHSSGVEAHFAAANTTHDGHLTKVQAEQSDWTRVAKHFDEIDADHRGWISVEQIHAFNRTHRGHRKATSS